MSRPYDLPSMTALLCFEAAARHESFKAAAAELNVTPAAVSHQVKALEQELARPLFLRHHRGVELTEPGAWLFLALQRGFEGISDAVGQVRFHGGDAQVAIQATTAVSSLWLTPQIAAFWKRHPHVAVSQLVSDQGGVSGRADLSVHYGVLPGGGETHLLFRDRILALGAPGYAAEHGIASAADLLRAPLVHLESEETGWTRWSDWFAAQGLGAPRGRRYAVNNYMIALRAAQDGIGAVLGWSGLVDGLIASGDLVPLVPDAVDSPVGFHLAVHPRASDEALLFRDFLLGQGG
ncbi:LysR substrate-binding domain-containing protein [Rhodovulum sp. DZ06]|uniref:LysR substrate-binding domain-containing protein n=1 Tax=Rhodovulum sp. DZ06 TaxID=3425126 RepID=UPI003D34E020